LLFGFPRAVIATAFATMIAFMGIGVVDPILPVIGRQMGASPAQVEMLFTTYIAVMSLAMLLSGVLSTRLGGRRTMLLGLLLVIIFSTISGLSDTVWHLAEARGGWGLGNAFFTSTALAIIVGLSSGGTARAITLYEMALGLGISSGPLIGGFLGSISWRLPFFGTAALMAIAFAATFFTVQEPEKREQPRRARDIFRALGHGNVLTNALAGLGYSFGFFTILAYSPIYLRLPALPLGLTYFAWGILVAISSVFIVNWLRPRMGALRLLEWNLVLFALLMVGLFLVRGTLPVLLLIVASGLLCGIANALFTTLAIEISPFTRSISSGAYNFLRWAGAAVAPVLSGYLDKAFSPQLPFLVSAGVVAMATILLAVRRQPMGVAIAAAAAEFEGSA
jgi:ACDE family multidrug resistance protein